MRRSFQQLEGRRTGTTPPGRGRGFGVEEGSRAPATRLNAPGMLGFGVLMDSATNRAQLSTARRRPDRIK